VAAATGEAEHQQRYHNDALPDRAGFIPLLVVTGALLINRWRYCRISNRCLDKGTTFLELASTCFMLSSLDVNASKNKEGKI
jgi:hypothetical protein